MIKKIILLLVVVGGMAHGQTNLSVLDIKTGFSESQFNLAIKGIPDVFDVKRVYPLSKAQIEAVNNVYDQLGRFWGHYLFECHLISFQYGGKWYVVAIYIHSSGWSYALYE
jgi:hypothetical protein